MEVGSSPNHPYTEPLADPTSRSRAVAWGLRSTVVVKIQGESTGYDIVRLVGPGQEASAQECETAPEVSFVVTQPGMYSVEIPVGDGLSVYGDRQVNVELGEAYVVLLRIATECRIAVRITNEQGALVTAVGRMDLGHLPACMAPLYAVVSSGSPGDTWPGEGLLQEGGTLTWEGGSFVGGPLRWPVGDLEGEWVSGLVTQSTLPPFVVSIVVGQKVVASRLVLACDGMVEIVLSEALLGDIEYSLRGRIVDLESGAPPFTRGGLAIMREPRTRAYFLAPVSKDGRFRVDHIPPGMWNLLVEFDGYERKVIPFVAEAGRDEDMGTIALREGRYISGRVQREDGEGVQVPVWVGTLDQGAKDLGIGKLPDEAVDANGYFAVFNLPPEHLVVGIHANPEWCMQPVIVDASEGPIVNLTLVVHKGVELRIESSKELPAEYGAFLEDAAGLCVWKRLQGEQGPWEFRVAEGHYELVSGFRRIPVDAHAGHASVTIE